MRLTLGSTCVLLLATACGGESSELGALTGPPIALRVPDATPSCFTAPPPADSAAEPPDAFQQMLSAARSMAEFRLSFALQEATLLSRPVIEDPTASSWNQQFEGGSIEGGVLARGNEWSVLKMVMIATFPDGRRTSLDADIDVTPRRTVYDFGGDRVLEVHENFYRFGDIVHGCDPSTGISFEVWPVPAANGSIVLERRCWPEPEVDESPAPGGQYGASLHLQCLQRIESALLQP